MLATLKKKQRCQCIRGAVRLSEQQQHHRHGISEAAEEGEKEAEEEESLLTRVVGSKIRHDEEQCPDEKGKQDAHTCFSSEYTDEKTAHNRESFAIVSVRLHLRVCVGLLFSFLCVFVSRQ